MILSGLLEAVRRQAICQTLPGVNLKLFPGFLTEVRLVHRYDIWVQR